MGLDLKIVGGTIVDGTGRPAYRGDIGIEGGVITAVGDAPGVARRVIDADGALVTPGFVDVHTHYDGQISWDEALAPSVSHGVTTVVMGNCGVGFAPVRPTDHERLIRLMEGVEDIPGSALAEGLSWDWETLPEYMDALDRRPHTIDFSVQAPHDAVRVYVMGERALADEEATDDDIARMRALVGEALDAGAVGFSTGRSDVHRTADGDWTPASEASTRELVGIAEAFRGRAHGVLQAVSDFDYERAPERFDAEFDVLERMVEASGGRPFSLSLMQRDLVPRQWRQILARSEQAAARGLTWRVQVAPRAIGVNVGLQCTFHPFMGFPSYKAISGLPLGERVAAMRDPAFRERLLTERSEPLAGDGTAIPPLVDKFLAAIEMIAFKLFALGDDPDYEQPIERSLGARAQGLGLPPLRVVYDALLEDDGRALLYFPIYNYTEFNYQNVLTMMRHPQAIPGLSDGGAHVGTVCDASFPTYLLSYWTRDRKGEQLGLPRAVQMLTADTARHIGYRDRGLLAPGMKADVNVIDHANLRLRAPRMVQDLPAGGQRLLQAARGYKATIVAGEVVVEDDAVTDARPGRLARIGPSGQAV
ncbi:MAG: amidohydrolase family protein [Nannocystaceae bacterium]|nr:amidohydrolase family protein [Myxococcales bacterium]